MHVCNFYCWWSEGIFSQIKAPGGLYHFFSYVKKKKKEKKATSDEMKSVTLHYFTTERFTGNFLS